MTNKEALDLVLKATEPGVRISRNGYYLVELAVMKLAELVVQQEEMAKAKEEAEKKE